MNVSERGEPLSFRSNYGPLGPRFGRGPFFSEGTILYDDVSFVG
jgi:hypothetical protein